MRVRHIPLILITVFLAVICALGLAACGDNKTEQLNAPVIELTDNVLSWSAVNHADGYEVYEGTTLVSSQTATSYTINKTETGTYEYTVKATSTNEKYTTSVASNEISYNYTATVTQLAAPQITLTGNVITWTAVENANLYEVYENGIVVGRQTATSFTIVQTVVGEYEYTVKALSTNPSFTTSEVSNVEIYIVEDKEVVDPVQLDAPAISINEATGVISWAAVENATSYVVFENGGVVSTQSGTSYTIVQTIVDTYDYYVVATSSSAKYLPSEHSNIVSFTVLPVQLATPVISLEGRLITWEQIDNAAYYEVYEFNKLVWTVMPEPPGELEEEIPELAYAITQLRYGTYTYTVVAISTSKQYTNSLPSNEVVYVYEDNTPVLAAPVISIDSETGVISWAAVENADGYDIYENGKRIDWTEGLSYTITRLNPATYTYSVRASNSEGEYKSSAQSNSVEYTVVAKEMTFTINVVIPSEYTTLIFTVGLYAGDDLIESKEVIVEADKLTGTVEFTAMAGVYTAKIISDIADGYVATNATVSAELATDNIRILKLSGNSLTLGTNTFSVRADQVGSDQTYIFVATAGGAYSITTNETREMTIFVNGSPLIVISATERINVATFYVSAGDAVEFGLVGGVVGSNYTFEIIEGEVKQELKITTGYGGTANYINHSCTRYLTLEERTTFVFFFTTATINTRIVTITINGVEYEFDGNENCMQEITIEAGEDIEISIDIYGEQFEDWVSIAFFVYPID